MRRIALSVFLLVAVLLFPAASHAQAVLAGRGEVLSPTDPKLANNTVNAKVALRYLDGAKVAPGVVFSFNAAVGPRTLDRGFVTGVSGSGGRYFPDVGGGVCQAATALHRAVVNAGLQVVERHRHTGGVPYAPKGDDAAVWWGKQDYRFRNTLPVPVAVKTWSSGQQLVVELHAEGLPEGDYRAVFFVGQSVCVVGGGLRKAVGRAYISGGRAYVPTREFALAIGYSEAEVARRVFSSARSRSYVPVRNAAAAFGFDVRWDPDVRAVILV